MDDLRQPGPARTGALIALGVVVVFVVASAVAAGAPGLALLIFSFAAVIALPIVLAGRALRGSRVEAAEAAKRAELAQFTEAGWQIARTNLRGTVVRGEHAGVRFEHYMAPPAGKNTPPQPAVSVPTTAPGEFHVHPESGTTETAKALGMVDEFRSGDVKLDLNYFFSGTTDEYVRGVFGVPENLDVLRALFAMGFDQLEKTRGRIVATRPDGGYRSIEEVRAAVDQLSRLRLPPVVAGAEGKKLLGRKALYILRAAAVALFVAGAAGFFAGKPLLEGWSGFVGNTILLAAVPGLAIFAAGYFLLRGRSMSVRGIVELLVLLPLIVPALFGVLALANERLDSSAAEEHEVRLVRYWYTKGSKGGTSFHLEFESWRGRGTEEIRNVGGDVYSLARDGQFWKLRLRRGWLDCPWVEAMAPVR